MWCAGSNTNNAEITLLSYPLLRYCGDNANNDNIMITTSSQHIITSYYPVVLSLISRCAAVRWLLYIIFAVVLFVPADKKGLLYYFCCRRDCGFLLPFFYTPAYLYAPSYHYYCLRRPATAVFLCVPSFCNTILQRHSRVVLCAGCGFFSSLLLLLCDDDMMMRTLCLLLCLLRYHMGMNM